MNILELTQISANKGNPYNKQIINHDSNLSKVFPKPNIILPEKLISSVTNHIESNDSFTIVIVTFSPEILASLSSRNIIDDLPYELADIYHFHLNPNDSRSNLINSAKFSKPEYEWFVLLFVH